MSGHYLDHASTSPPRPEVVSAMAQWLDSGPSADPGRLHHPGRLARAALEDSREAVAGFVGSRAREVVLTSSGTEAVNAAVWGACRALPGGVVVLAEVEHSSVRQASARLAPVEVVPVDERGHLEVDALGEVLDRLAARRQPVALVHCQAANHEVGSLQPLVEVVEVARSHEVPVHVDACAAAGHVALSFDDLGADLLSVSAHKFGGPPGAGALLVRRGLRLEPLLVGGEQERARRAGFENVLGAVGFAAACDALSGGRLEQEAEQSRGRRDGLEKAALEVPGVSVLGDPERRLPHLLCLGLTDVEAEPVLLGLDRAGVFVHSGSSCSSESLEPSPVLAAMGADAQRSLRLSVGWCTTDEDVEAFAAAFAPVVDGLRALGR
ncbi:MAG TPA: aminotransferase class V-fold PLP-dependent enzyme [Acidimicrobiales bacterium]|nr:aminotransferase class V-fold PLP-dependent enzyme [Acidimicrobiales bacterium]